MDDFENSQGPKPSKSNVAVRQRGDTLFAIGMFLLSTFSLSQIGSQTKWIDGVKFLLQPRFWPGLSLLGMLLFSMGYLIQSIRDVGRSNAHTFNNRIWQPQELVNWLRTLEYAAYFLIYVTAIPKLGYLPATLIFCLLLTIRVGYRNLTFIGWSLLGGFIIVLVFKTFLQVKLPAGAFYDLLPGPISTLLIRYF